MTHPKTAGAQDVPAFRQRMLECFAIGNLAFLAVDIYLAHAYNDFALKSEWIPFVFSILGSIALLPQLLRSFRGGSFSRRMGIAVGSLSILVGFVGFLFHLESQFLILGNVMSLVYSAPLAAPLAYCGIGMLLLLNRLEVENQDWGAWVVFLAAGGFFGNFALTLLDHAQNGFAHESEWLAVGSSAFAWSFLIVASTPWANATLLKATAWIMALQIIVGTLGAFLHFRANANGVSESIWDNFVYGAPFFAPLLMCDMAILGLLGLYDRGANKNLTPTS